MIECIDKFFPEGTKRTFPDGGLGNKCMRISFSSVVPEKIRIGVEKLGNLICSKLK